MSAAPPVRIDRLLANLGYGTRSETQAMIAGGWVTLGGATVRDGRHKVRPTPDLCASMRVAGAPLDPPPPLTLILHKPLGAVCSHKESGRSVYELLPERWRRRSPSLSTIGRLDRDTSGLLLMTDDGALLHKVISPRRHVAKRYCVTLEKPLGDGEGALFASGTMTLEGEQRPLAPAILESLGPASARITITEGRYHQVRRMFAATGNHVVSLHRDKIGELGLTDALGPGQWRILDDHERGLLFTATPQSAG